MITDAMYEKEPTYILKMSKRKVNDIDCNAAKKYKSRFQEEWLRKFNWIRRGKDSNSAFCACCKLNFNVCYGGQSDVKSHEKTKRHEEAANATKCAPIRQFFTTKKDDDAVHRAEVIMTNFIVQHNLSFLTADDLTDVMKHAFPDSNLIQQYACKRTKTTAITVEAMGPHYNERVVQLCCSQKYSLLLDESNDRVDNKILAILVRVFDPDVNAVCTYFLSSPICNLATAENLFKTIKDVMTEKGIPWSNCCGYMSDNASVMVGKHNSVLSRIREMNPKVFDLGCVCHIANLVVKDGLKQLPIDVDEILADIYIHFRQSAKRKEILKEFQVFTDTDQKKILKHCPTRWLTLLTVVTRTLEQWEALKSYFNSHEDVEKKGRVQKLAEHLNNPEVWLYFSFLEHFLPIMNEFNKTFQTEESMIGYVHDEAKGLLRRLLGKFVTTKAIKSSSILTVNLKDRSLQHEDDNLSIGKNARSYIQEKDVELETVNKFYGSVRAVYEGATLKLRKRFPFADQTLKTLAFLNPKTREKVTTDDISTLATDLVVNLDMRALEDEFLDYQLCQDSELPDFEEGTSLQEFWGNMFKRHRTYASLNKLAVVAMTLPHSNAETERLFSTLRKIQTDSRSHLTPSTCDMNILNIKINNNEPCAKYEPPKTVIKLAGKAATRYNLKAKDDRANE